MSIHLKYDHKYSHFRNTDIISVAASSTDHIMDITMVSFKLSQKL